MIQLTKVKIQTCNSGKFLCVYHSGEVANIDIEICELLMIDIDEYQKKMISFGGILVNTVVEEGEIFFLKGKDARYAKRYLEKNMVGYLVAKALMS